MDDVICLIYTWKVPGVPIIIQNTKKTHGQSSKQFIPKNMATQSLNQTKHYFVKMPCNCNFMEHIAM